MDTRQKCPPLNEKLFEYLDSRFPNRCARPGETLEKIWRDAGARLVIDHLRTVYEHQREDMRVTEGP